MKFICFASAALAAMTKRDAHLEANNFAKTEQCEDSDWYFGWTDSYGDGCDWYWDNADACGAYDIPYVFFADYDCCACGGGAWMVYSC